MRIRIDSGKYTFVKESFRIHVRRHDEPWIEDLDGANAVFSLMAELDAARVVLAEVRKLIADRDRLGMPDGEDHAKLRNALQLHDSLVSDNEPPSTWSTIRDEDLNSPR